MGRDYKDTWQEKQNMRKRIEKIRETVDEILKGELTEKSVRRISTLNYKIEVLELRLSKEFKIKPFQDYTIL